MSWLTKTLSSTIGRKLVMALTGLFLCSFLVVHLIGNLQLFNNDGGAAFNTYSEFMGHNPIIRTLEIVLMLGFVFHIYDAYVLAARNKSARSVGYAVNRPEQNSHWSSRNMGLLGTVILVFLLVHLYNFFWRARFGEVPNDQYGNENLYLVVVESFQIWWYVSLYVIAMAALCFHLIHGFASAFQTLGWNHKKYTPAVKAVSYGFSILVCLGFAAMPLYFFFQR